MKFGLTKLIVAATVAMTLTVIPVLPSLQQAFQASAQNIGQRIVSGAVVNDAGTAQLGATVFLKNLKTKAIRSYTTTEDGKFRFTQVNMSDDQEVWAELSGKKTPVKTVSSWDGRKQFECELKLK